MQRRHKQKESNARRDKDRLDAEIAKLDNQLAELSPLPELSQQLTQLEAEHRQIVIKADQFAGLTRFITDLDSAIRSEQLFLHRSQASKDLTRPPDLMETNALQKLVENLQTSQRREALEADRLRATQALQPLPAQRDVAALSLTIAQLKQITKERDKQRETSTAVAELKSPPIQQDPAPLAREIAQLQLAEKKANQLLNRHRRLMQLQAVPDQIDISPMLKTIELLENAATKATTAQRALRRAEQNLLQLREQIQRWVDDNPKCQSCGQTINAELVISGGHDHA
jgi:exonuclease SbcC